MSTENKDAFIFLNNIIFPFKLYRVFLVYLYMSYYSLKRRRNKHKNWYQKQILLCENPQTPIVYAIIKLDKVKFVFSLIIINYWVNMLWNITILYYYVHILL